MERALLKRYLDEGLSLIQIGELAGRDPSTVGYWVQKHGLTANGRTKYAPRGGLTKEQLEPLVEANLTAAEIAERLGRHPRTIHYWLKKHGLRLAGHWRRDEATAARAAGHLRFQSRCRKHGITSFFALPGGRSRCAACNKVAVAEWRRRAKRTLVAEAGGKCVICGYDRWVGALEFHHLDPTEKQFGLASLGATRAMEKLRLEASKCVLLCSNCHAEVEGGVARVP